MTKQFRLSLATILALVSFTPVQAQPAKPMILVQSPSSNPSTKINKPLIFNAPPPPPPGGISAPGDRVGAGKRGCPDVNVQNTQSNDKQLTALVPVYSNPESVIGLTTDERPTFWFYVPYESSSIYAELVLDDDEPKQTEQAVYKIPLTGTPGVVSVPLPSTPSPLKIGKRYHWYFNIYCKRDKQVVSFVEGYVQHQQLKAVDKSQLEKAAPRDKAAFYAAHGIWYEALTTLANLRRKSPQDATLATDWASLLRSVGLENIASEPLVECCKPEDGMLTSDT